MLYLLCTQVPEDSEEAAAEETQQKDEEVNEEVPSEEETWEDKEGKCWRIKAADGVRCSRVELLLYSALL